MRLLHSLLALPVWLRLVIAQSTTGIEELVRRRLPDHVDKFSFSLKNPITHTAAFNVSDRPNDEYTVSNGADNTIHISGNSPIALAYGLRYYLTTYCHVDMYWHINSQLYLAPKNLPKLNSTYHGSSIVPWRYHFNTVTFSYTPAWWQWEDWEIQLDWMALHGINLPLAWVGYERILMDVLVEFGFSNDDIAQFLCGPAFQAWNRLGNIQGAWGGNRPMSKTSSSLPVSWQNAQLELQKQIIARMVELGMTPILPAFTGFVPRATSKLFPHASLVKSGIWNYFPPWLTNDLFVEPSDPLFTKMQKSFIKKTHEAYGTVSHIYTLDQYNENDPHSGSTSYLHNVAKNTIKALKAADPDAVWMMQGWLFYSSEDFWTNERVEAYLGGVKNSDMIILDLFSESQPQWQRTNSYYGKPWIWCQLHDYGGNMGLYGQVENVTHNPIEALGNSTSTMVGMGLTMEGQEGNQIIYDIMLDQAWSKTPLDSHSYFRDWVETRYHSTTLPKGMYTAWDSLRTTVYNNTNLAIADSVTKSIFELLPNTTGLLNITGTHSTDIMYEPSILVEAWRYFYASAEEDPSLWDNEAYSYDLTDITRQVMANAFKTFYEIFIYTSNATHKSYNRKVAMEAGSKMVTLLADLDAVLTASVQPAFSLPAWIASARAWAYRAPAGPNWTSKANTVQAEASYYEYNARNQISLWGPVGEISDYASKQWGGLIRTYYIPRWQLFVGYTLSTYTDPGGGNAALSVALLGFEEEWQIQTWGIAPGEVYEVPSPGALQQTIYDVVAKWKDVFLK